MRASRRSGFLATSLLLALVLPIAATATPIQMTPNPAVIDAAVGNDFSLRLDAGDSATNVLQFTVTGGGGCGLFCSSTAVAAIVFDGATVLSATDADSSLFSAGNVVRGLVTPDGAVAGLLIDAGSPSSESFALRLSSTPTTATLYSLSLDSLNRLRRLSDVTSSFVESTKLTFSVRGAAGAVVPEPSAAIVYGLGLLVAGAALRSRRQASTAGE
ncbi:MAG: hypothetical protein U0900_19580 [Myxococcota bacterium]